MEQAGLFYGRACVLLPFPERTNIYFSSLFREIKTLHVRRFPNMFPEHTHQNIFKCVEN